MTWITASAASVIAGVPITSAVTPTQHPIKRRIAAPFKDIADAEGTIELAEHSPAAAATQPWL
jgi:hypothetical protein